VVRKVFLFLLIGFNLSIAKKYFTGLERLASKEQNLYSLYDNLDIVKKAFESKYKKKLPEIDPFNHTAARETLLYFELKKKSEEEAFPFFNDILMEYENRLKEHKKDTVDTLNDIDESYNDVTE
jgi:hypothetical protein